MGLGELVSSLFALNQDADRNKNDKRIIFSRRKKMADGTTDISQTTAVSEPDSVTKTVFIDPRMHFAMSVSRNIERCVFKLLCSNTKFETSKEYFRARDIEYDIDRTEECGEAYVFIEKNRAGRLRVYAQFRRNQDDAVGQFSSDMPNNTDITNRYKAGEITFGRIKQDM